MQQLSNDLQENFDRFIVESLEQGCVWGLQNSEGNWATVQSETNSDLDAMPFWSVLAFAQSLCTDDWEIYRPTAIAIEEFLDDWLPGLHSDVILVGVNWNSTLDGEEIEPLDLLEEFDAELG